MTFPFLQLPEGLCHTIYSCLCYPVSIPMWVTSIYQPTCESKHTSKQTRIIAPFEKHQRAGPLRMIRFKTLKHAVR